MSSLEKCYDDVKRAQAFLKQMLIDIINCNPEIIGRGTPIVGVTDGTDAQPGMVGEYVQFISPVQNIAAAGAFNQTLSMGVLSAGDWDCQSWGQFNPGVDAVDVILNPLPAGFPLNWYGADGKEGQAEVNQSIRALTSVPTLIAIQVSGTAASAGTYFITFTARRRR